jgi:putative transposase
VTGRKRHLVVDTLGLLLAVVVHAANVQDRDGAKLVLAKLAGRFPRLGLLWADGGYAGTLLVWALAVGGWVIELVKKPAGATTFAVLPKRWIVERTFAWLGRCRRLSKDYEALPATSEAWIHVAMIALMLKRLAPR